MPEQIKTLYSNMHRGAFWATLVTTIVLFIASFIVPPTGEISPTVLQASAVLMGFGVLATVNNGIERGKTVTLNKGDLNMTVGDKDSQSL